MTDQHLFGTLRPLLLPTLCALIFSSQAWAQPGTGTGLKGGYYGNTGLTGAVALSRTDSTINFQWGAAGPAPAIPADRFSVRWTGQVEAPVSGAYTFVTRSDDGVRLWIDGKVLINHWSDHSPAWDQAVPVDLVAGHRYNIQLEYYENMGGSVIQLLWSYPGQTEQAIPQQRLYPATIPVLVAPPVLSRVLISDLPWLSSSNGWGPAELNRSNGDQGARDGKSLTIAGHRYADGLGVHAPSEIRYALDDRYDMFRAIVGVDDETGDNGSVVFEVWLDGKRAYKSPVMRGNMPGLAIEVPVENALEMRLVVTGAGDGINWDHADWAGARLEGIETIKYLSDLNWVTASNGAGPVEKDRANGGAASGDAERIKLRGRTFRKGLGTKAASEIKYNLDKKYELLSAMIGIDDSANGAGSAIFEIWNGTTRLYRSDILHGKDAARHVDVSVLGLDTVTLKVLDAGDGNSGDLADWADAKLLPIGSDSDNAPAPGTPAAPASLTATPGNAQVSLAWKASTGAASYNLYRGTGANAEFPTAIATNITATTYTNTGLTNGTPYFYKVRAVNTLGAGAPSNEATAMPVGGPLPGAPSGLTAAPGNTQVTLAWSAVTGATGYNIYRGGAANGESPNAIATNVNATTFVNSGLTNGTPYFYNVRAVNASGAGAASNEANATPAAPPPQGAPTGLTATPGNALVTLKWTAVTGVTGYNVYRGVASNGEAAAPVVTNLNAVTFSNTGLTNGTTYFYKVAAVNAGGAGPSSNEASAMPLALPAAPTGITVTEGNGQIALNWPAVATATAYNVYRGIAKNGEAAVAVGANLPAPAFVNTGLTNGTAYFYKVTAINTTGESARSAEVTGTPSGPPPATDPATLSAFRLLRQATWGPRPGDVDHVKQIGRAAFLAEQLAAPASVYPDTLYDMTVEMTQEHFMRLAITGPDQLRQRLAWALHQIWIASAVEVGNAGGIVNYQRIFINGAFGNYRDLMAAVTLNPVMGRYLNMLNNQSQTVTGVPANENYAREVMQLFTLGLTKINTNGTPMLDGLGKPIPTYTEDDVKQLARILTGWTFGDGNPATIPTTLAAENYKVPMEAVEKFHDSGAKTFLGVNFAPGQTARQDLNQALDVIFAHANMGPFICRQLIEHLVTSNPSAAYIGDVAAVFNNNGSNVRGDLTAVVQAILTHPEASLGTATAGKLMEPALFVVSQARSLNAQVVDHPFMTDLAEEMGQKVFYSPSVFSYFSPNYRIRNTALVGPEFQILTSVTSLIRTNFSAMLISGGFGADVTVDFAPFTSRAADPAALVDYCSLLLMGGNMSTEQRSEIISAVRVTPATNLAERARTALYLILASAQYQADH